MRIGVDGKEISGCNQCIQQRHSLPNGYRCSDDRTGDMQTPKEGFPRWCPLEEPEEKKPDDNQKLIDRITNLAKGADSEILDEVLAKLNPGSPIDLPPRPWKASELNEATVLLDNDEQCICVYLHPDPKYLVAVMDLFETAPDFFAVCEDLLDWAETRGGDGWLKELLEHAKDAVDIVRNEK